MEHIEGYQRFEEIGRGGSGIVYRALELDTDREVAIKIIEPIFANTPDFIRRFDQEGQSAARLEHPHIVPLYRYHRNPHRAFLVMRYMRGRSLRDWLSQQGPVDLLLAAQLLDQIAFALSYAHHRNIIHRDIKPGNILLDEDGNFYLADFSVALQLAGNVQIGDGGTPSYAAPEQWECGKITPQTDIYSLGITLYEALCGKNPFFFMSPEKALQMRFDEPLSRLSEAHTNIPVAVDNVIQTATANDPASRYNDAIAMAAAYREAITQPIARPVAALATPALQIRIASNSITNSALTPVNPYKGLYAFQETDSSDFYGRQSFTNRLLQRLNEPGENTRFLAVIGASGSGKSSAVQAGLIPALRQGALPNSQDWFYINMTPGKQPFRNLESALSRMADKPLSIPDDWTQNNAAGLSQVVKQILPESDCELLLFIDQFEELFTLCDDETERSAFINNLVHSVYGMQGAIRIILALRADFYDRPLMYPTFAELIRQRTEVIIPLSNEELRDAIASPALKSGLVLEDGLVETIIQDVGKQPGVLPLLQYTLTELYQRREGNCLTHAAYQAIDRIEGAVSRGADTIFTGLNTEHQEISRQLFLRLITVGDGVEATRRRVRRSELAISGTHTDKALHWDKSAVNQVIDIFNKGRLLILDYDPLTSSATVEIAHEALIRAWERLRNWLNQSREDLLIQQRLNAAAIEWQNANQDKSFLAEGARLTQFENLALSANLVLSEQEQAYLDASIGEHQQRETEREAQQRQLLRLQTRVIRILGVFLLTAIILSLLALLSRQEAVTQARIAVSRQLAAQAVAELQRPLGNDEVAALLAIRALKNHYDPVADGALTEAVKKLPSKAFTGHSGPIYSAVFSPDGKTILTASGDQTARLWELGTGKKIRTFSGHSGDVYSAVFSPDGKTILTASGDQTARLWELGTGKEIRTFSGHSSDVYKAVFSPDGKHVFTTSEDHSARMWDVETGELLHSFVDENLARGLAVSPDEKYIVTSGDQYTAHLWDVATGQAIRTFTGHNNSVYAIAFSPDGKYILTGSIDNTAKLWLAKTGDEVYTFQGHSSSVRGVAFSPDGKYILTGSGDRNVKLWELATGQEIAAYRGHTDRVWSVAFSVDGTSILTGSADYTAKLWNVVPNPGSNTFAAHLDEIYGVAFSPDGDYALTGSADQTAKLWEVDTQKELHTFTRHNGTVYDVAFSPDGKFAATGSVDHTAKVWDTSVGAEIYTFRSHTEPIWSVAFSPDGKFLLTGSGDFTAKLWELSTGQEIKTFADHEDDILSVAFSADGEHILTGSSDYTAKLWETATGRVIKTFNVDGANIFSVSFSPDGKSVLMSGDDRLVRLWNIESGQITQTLSGHSNTIYNAVFSPDGAYILTSSADRTARIWDSATGELVRLLRGHSHAVWGIAFSPKDNLVLTGSLDGTATLWQTNYHDFVEEACSQMLRDLTAEEREQFSIINETPTCTDS